MNLKDGLVAVFAGVIITVVIAAIVFVGFIELLMAEPARSAVLSDASYGTLLLSVLALYGIEAAILFLLPPIVTTLMHEKTDASGKVENLFVISFASSAITALIILAMMHLLSTEGLGKVFSSGSGSVCCLASFIFWTVASGLVGPATSWVKKKWIDKNKDTIKKNDGKDKRV